MASFVSTRLANLVQPIAGPNGQANATAMGTAQDAEAANLRLVGKLRAPALIDATAVNDVGAGFQIPRYASQSDATYQASVVAAWNTYAEAGSPRAIIDQLHAYGITDVRVVLEEGNHGATAVYNGAGTYNRGALVKSPNGAGVQTIFEQVGPNGAAAAATPPTTQGQAQADGSCVWAWRGVATQDANDSGYPAWWYSRFDVVLGGQTAGNFGTLAVNKFVISGSSIQTLGSFTTPAIGSTVSVSLGGSGISVNTIVYVGQAGYYKIVSGSGPFLLQNLGDAAAAYAAWWSLNAPAGGIFAPDVWGATGQFPNAVVGSSISAGQSVVLGGSGIVGQTRIGIAIVDDAARVAIKSLILRWKATHGYAGRLVLATNGANLDPAGQPGFYNGTTNIGRMIGINLQIPFTIGGYDRS